jgi:preprotein translocase SecE subunit
MASVTKGDEENRATAEDGDAGTGTGNGTGAKQYPAGKAEKPAKAAKDKARDKGDATDTERDRPAAPGGRPRGYFTIYKKGQGYWTRMGTLAGAAVLGVMLAYTLYVSIPPMLSVPDTKGMSVQQVQEVQKAAAVFGKRLALGVAGGFLVVYSLIVWHLTNKPSNVDFLVATDSEMKKVNWTSRKELIGSTKVVIFFMFLIATILFVLDRVIGTLMYFMGVLKNPWWGGGG